MKVIFVDKWIKFNMEYSMGNMKDVSIDEMQPRRSFLDD